MMTEQMQFDRSGSDWCLPALDPVDDGGQVEDTADDLLL